MANRLSVNSVFVERTSWNSCSASPEKDPWRTHLTYLPACPPFIDSEELTPLLLFPWKAQIRIQSSFSSLPPALHLTWTIFLLFFGEVTTCAVNPNTCDPTGTILPCESESLSINHFYSTLSSLSPPQNLTFNAYDISRPSGSCPHGWLHICSWKCPLYSCWLSGLYFSKKNLATGLKLIQIYMQVQEAVHPSSICDPIRRKESRVAEANSCTGPCDLPVLLPDQVTDVPERIQVYSSSPALLQNILWWIRLESKKNLLQAHLYEKSWTLSLRKYINKDLQRWLWKAPWGIFKRIKVGIPKDKESK